MRTAFPSIALGLLASALGWAVFFKGGVWPDQWCVALALIGAASCLFALCGTGEKRCSPPLNAWLGWLLIAIPAYIALTIVPLPSGLLQILSPARAALLHRLQPVLPGARFAPLSVNPPATILALFTAIGYIAAFWTIRGIAIALRDRRWISAIPLIVIAACEAVLGLLQSFLGNPGTAAAGTYANRDHFAGLLEIVFPFALLSGWAAFRERRLALACASWSVAALLFAAILFSFSRMGFIVALFILFLIAVLLFGARVRSRSSKWLIAASAATAVLAACVLFTPDELAGRFAALSSKDSASVEIRGAIWSETLPLIAEFKLFGCGAGGYPSAFAKHQAVANAYAVEFAHNDYLQYLAEFGVSGFLLVAAAASLLLRDLIVVLFRNGQENQRLLIIACTASFAGMALHSFVDFNTYIPANALALAWVGGLASAISPE